MQQPLELALRSRPKDTQAEISLAGITLAACQQVRKWDKQWVLPIPAYTQKSNTQRLGSSGRGKSTRGGGGKGAGTGLQLW